MDSLYCCKQLEDLIEKMSKIQENTDIEGKSSEGKTWPNVKQTESVIILEILMEPKKR